MRLKMPRLHILGAPGSGTSTLGAALARRLGVQHADSDGYFWLPDDPPYRRTRPLPERLALVTQQLPANKGWVFSGASTKWATPLERHYELIVFLRLDPELRMERLRRREHARHGARILPGGDMEAASAAFLAWAAAYDTAGASRRGLATHEAWLADQTTPVLRLDSQEGVESLVEAVLDRLRSIGRF
jgi:adenylate kinase family enzyme